MNLDQPRKEIQFLKSEIKKHNKKYYIDNNQEITDHQFDELNKKLYKILADFPELQEEFNDIELLGSPLNDIDIEDNKKKSHIKPMFSLQNIFNIIELIEFDKRIYRFFNLEINKKYEQIESYCKKIYNDSEINFFNLAQEYIRKSFKEDQQNFQSEFEYCIEEKFDGLSFSATYINSYFSTGLTRGDGFVGEDITSNLFCLLDFPKKLNLDIFKKIEIRGEIFMPIKKFHELNLKFKEKGEKEFVNPRNAASGSLRILDQNEFKNRGLKYFSYSIGFFELNENSEKNNSMLPKTQYQTLMFLENLGFKICKNIFISNNLLEIYKIYLNSLNKRNELEYEIDGLVIKINDLSNQDRLSQTGKYPRWAAAFKFPSHDAITRIIDIEFSVGRTGAITPVAHVEPIKISGATIIKCSLHNFDEIKKLDIMINDLVIIKRSGDVIPQVISVLKNKRSEEELKNKFLRQKIIMPNQCPSCKKSIFKQKDEAVLRCKNFYCKSKMIEYIKYFCSRDAFNIIGLGEKQINYFFENNFIKNPVDIFFLEQNFSEEIKNLENWGEKSAANLFINIEKSKNIVFSKFIYSLGIRFCGEMTSKILTKFFKNIENFISFVNSFEETNLSTNKADKKNYEYISELNEIDGIGEKAIQSIELFFSEKENRIFINKLLNILNNIIFDNQNDDINSISSSEQNIFFQKNIVFTGSLKHFSRQEIKEIAIKNLGSNVQSSVTKTSDFLIFGDGAGSKLQKASENKKIQIMSEDEFVKILKKLNIIDK
jgi:DNA ligase (NAD+)